MRDALTDRLVEAAACMTTNTFLLRVYLLVLHEAAQANEGDTAVPFSKLISKGTVFMIGH